ncbi:hypothetical protein CRUP_024502 [Coryphaenoides rupestris]|nr:hypothetical protein CRUP_024502 [Coryphaenoides rupestris]
MDSEINPDLLQPSKSFKKPSSGTITLNVGGFLYTAHRTTLAKYQGSLLEELANGKKPVQHTDSMGNPFIDRDGPVFRHVLNYLRTGDLLLPDDFREWDSSRKEAEFYRLGELVDAVSEWEEQRLAKREPAFLEVTDSHERSQAIRCTGQRTHCSYDKVKARLCRSPRAAWTVSPRSLRCHQRHVKLETACWHSRAGFKLITSLDSSKGSVVAAEALHFVK